MRRALVVDDAADLRLLLRYTLRAAGFEVAEADGGRAALEALSGDEMPDIVILDVQMPDMDGWEVLATLRAQAASADIPVIMCTVKERPEDVELAWEGGCDGYLAKPFDIADVIAEIDAVLARPADERATVRAAKLATARAESWLSRS